MNGSIKIGSVLGITIRVHLLLLLLIALFLFQSARVEHTAILLGVLFGIILLHELAHSIVAMRFGLRVVDITLWPLGGMARMTEMPESSRIEGLIAIAGPLSNFVLAGIGLPLWLWAVTSQNASPFMMELTGSFLWWNLTLGGFNLLPAFPMDGGRILRAFLGRKGDWVRATERAVTIGRAVAVMLALLGVLTIGWMGAQSILFILVAAFVWWAGTQELLAVRMRHGQDPLAAFRAFAARATGWSQTQPASEYAATPSPSGTAPRGFSKDPPPIHQQAPIHREAPRHQPAPGQQQAPGGTAGGSGFSAEEIARLERFHGPLRAFRPDET